MRCQLQFVVYLNKNQQKVYLFVCVFRFYDKHCDFMLNVMKLSDTRLNTVFLQIAFMKNILR